MLHDIQCSLVPLAVVFEPAADVLISRVVVRPVNDTALLIPFVFAKEFDIVTLAQCVDAWGKINIVRNQYGMVSIKSEYKSLMAIAIVVVG